MHCDILVNKFIFTIELTGLARKLTIYDVIGKEKNVIYYKKTHITKFAALFHFDIMFTKTQIELNFLI